MSLEARAADAAGTQRLATLGYAGQDRGLEAAAQEFEALFVELVLKSARSASLGDGLLDSAQGDLYRDMLDQQMASTLGAKGGLGIAELLVRAMGQGRTDAAAGSLDPSSAAALARVPRQPTPPLPVPEPGNGRDGAAPAAASGAAAASDLGAPLAFAHELWEPAQRAAASLGVAPEVLLAQAALETGWGRSLPRHPDGSTSHNLFGIKAGSSWQGPRVIVDTLEIEDGLPRRVKAAFRAYDSYAECFQDYARLVAGSPRYAGALARAEEPLRYLQELQQAGYATDPDYATKIGRILQGDALGVALAALKL